MAVVLDPHFKEPGNKQSGEAVTLIGTKYKMLVPAYAPFYTTSLVVKSGGKDLTMGDDYVITHPYMTGMERTAYLCHGMIWITNPKYYKDFTVDYHAVGGGMATPAQITAERELNKDVFPSSCQWDTVVGDVYFPPVDIQFDWDNWQGELELMNAIVGIGTKIGEITNIPDPVINNSYPVALNSYERLVYDNKGKYTFIDSTGIQYNCYIRLSTMRWDVPGTVRDYTAEFVMDLKGYQSWSGLPNTSWLALKNITKGVGSQEVWFDYSFTDQAWRVFYRNSVGNVKDYPLALFPFAPSKFGQPFTIKIVRAGKDVKFTLQQNNVVLGDYTLDVTNPPSDVLSFFNTYKLQTAFLNNGTEVQLTLAGGKDDTVRFKAFPGFDMSADVRNDVYQLMVQYHNIIRKLYDDAPAHAHVPRKDNPHGDSWGAIRALQLNGIASDATLVYGKTQPQLADYINDLLPKLATLANKLLRMPSAAQSINGTFGTKPGLTSVTSAVGTDESKGVGAQFTVDPKVIRFLGRDSTTINAGNNPVTWQSGNNQLILYPDARGLLWNGKKLLDPTTVAPYLPGNTGGSDGLFYGNSTATVTINGNGIQSVPFICTFVPPTSANLTVLAMRQLATEFGTSAALAATPALIAKLDTAFTGKLEKVKAYINDLPLTSSVYIDKTTFGLGNVANTADKDLPISTPQQTELNKYAVVGHTHQASVFGVQAATSTQFGLITYGLAVDDPALALDGSVAIQQTTQIAALEAIVKGVDAGAAIDIIRFGQPGSERIQNGAQINGWMVTLAAEKYFLGEEYTAPLTTFNLTELFPGAYEDTSMGIFVDVSNNAAKYLIMENPNTAQTDTMTKIGSIDTSETGIEVAEIHNVTRLGGFRELDEHKADNNAHIKRTMTMFEWGKNIPTGGPIWSSGVLSSLRCEGDWRGANGDGYFPMTGINYDQVKAQWVFDPVGTATTDYRFIHHAYPLIRNNNTLFTWTTADTTDTTVLEGIVAGWHDETNFFNRLSVMITRGFNFADSSGSYCYAALALNYGKGRNVVIGLTPTKFPAGGAASWATLQPTLKFNSARQAGGKDWAMVAELTLGGVLYFITVKLFATEMTLTCQRQGSTTAEMQTVDLSTRFRPDYIDVRPMMNDGDTPLYHGLGGKYGAEVRAAITYPGVNQYTQRYYGTLLDYMMNFSSLNRARFLEYPYVGGSVSPESLATTIAEAERGDYALVNPLPIPNYMNTDRVIAFCRNKLARAVIFRD